MKYCIKKFPLLQNEGKWRDSRAAAEGVGVRIKLYELTVTFFVKNYIFDGKYNNHDVLTFY
jgi:hypothetical protein